MASLMGMTRASLDGDGPLTVLFPICQKDLGGFRHRSVYLVAKLDCPNANTHREAFCVKRHFIRGESCYPASSARNQNPLRKENQLLFFSFFF